MKRILLFPEIFCLILVAASCSEDKTILTQNEKEYLATRDSMVKYKPEIMQLSKGSSSQVSDYIKLDYQSYKTKYDLSEKEMEILRITFDRRWEMAKALKAIRENTFRLDTAEYNKLNSKDSSKGNYLFDQELKPADHTISSDKDTEMKVLMEAFEKK